MIIRLFIRSFYAFAITALISGLFYLLHSPSLFPAPQNTLHIFLWGGFLAPEALNTFEKEYGVRLKLEYYSSNEELLAKMRATGGRNIDILFPSDYAVKILADEGYLKPLSKDRLPFIQNIEPKLMGHSFDPTNYYSLPYSWEIYGIAYNQKLLSKPIEPTLAQLFDPKLIDYKIVMTPDPLEAAHFALLYLFGEKDHLTKEEIGEISALLKKQKGWIEAYADYRAKYLIATENCPVALLRSYFLCQIAHENPNIVFKIPKEGAITSIETIAISSTCKNEEIAYAFINYFYKPEVMAKQINASSSAIFPAILSALDHTSPLTPNYYETLHEALLLDHLIIFHHFLPPEEMSQIWLDVKS